MTDSQDSLPLAAAESSLRKKSPAIWPLWLLIAVLFTGVSGAAAYFWLALDKQTIRINHSLKIESNMNQRLDQFERSVSSSIKSLESAASKQNTLLATLDKQALFNTRLLNQLHSSNRADWLLAETEYLLRLANQRLSIEDDVRGAEAILISADKVLAETDDPGLLPVRKKLAEDILSLQAIHTTDIDGLYVKLEALINSLDRLNKASFLTRQTSVIQKPSSVPNDPKNSSSLSLLWREIWADLKKAIVIRRLDQPIKPLLAPEQSYYLQQNLRLMLEQASVALLDRKQDAFKHSLEKASQWLSRYFDFTDEGIQALHSTINELKESQITHKVPDISGSLRLLKIRIEAMYRSHQLDRFGSNEAPTEAAK